MDKVTHCISIRQTNRWTEDEQQTQQNKTAENKYSVICLNQNLVAVTIWISMKGERCSSENKKNYFIFIFVISGFANIWWTE